MNQDLQMLREAQAAARKWQALSELQEREWQRWAWSALFQMLTFFLAGLLIGWVSHSWWSGK